jgi:chromosomal replication initiation ATPase DnaA
MRVRDILHAVSVETGISVDDIRGPRRSVRLRHPRFVTAWIARKHMGFSYTRIGRAISRDQSTVRYEISLVDTNLLLFKPLISAVQQRLGLPTRS